MYDTNRPIREQRCAPVYPGVNITLDLSGRLVPLPGAPLPAQWSPEEWEMNLVLKGGHRNQASQKAVDDIGLHTIRTWNVSLALWSVSLVIFTILSKVGLA